MIPGAALITAVAGRGPAIATLVSTAVCRSSISIRRFSGRTILVSAACCRTGSTVSGLLPGIIRCACPSLASGTSVWLSSSRRLGAWLIRSRRIGVRLAGGRRLAIRLACCRRLGAGLVVTGWLAIRLAGRRWLGAGLIYGRWLAYRISLSLRRAGLPPAGCANPRSAFSQVLHRPWPDYPINHHFPLLLKIPHRSKCLWTEHSIRFSFKKS